MKEKISIIIEYIWLGAFVLAIIAGSHKTYYHGFKQSWLFFAIAVVAILMFFLRRHFRKQQNVIKK